MTGGETSDYVAVPSLLAIPVCKPRLFLADKGYDGDFIREELLIHGIRPVIPPKANRKGMVKATKSKKRCTVCGSHCRCQRKRRA